MHGVPNPTLRLQTTNFTQNAPQLVQVSTTLLGVRNHFWGTGEKVLKNKKPRKVYIKASKPALFEWLAGTTR